MFSKKVALLTILLASTISLGGSPGDGLNVLAQNATRVSGLPISEPASLLLFGASLWAIAMLRRTRRQSPTG